MPLTLIIKIKTPKTAPLTNGQKNPKKNPQITRILTVQKTLKTLPTKRWLMFQQILINIPWNLQQLHKTVCIDNKLLLKLVE